MLRQFVAAGSIIFLASTAAGQNAISGRIRGGMFVKALRIEQAPRIDGVLDEECWQRAEPLTNFTQVLPVEGAPASERTEVRIVYTRDVLFIAVRAFDREPGKILAKSMQRDNAFDSDDYVKIAFDTFARQRDGYVFMVNPAGARTDSIFGKFSGLDVTYRITPSLTVVGTVHTDSSEADVDERIVSLSRFPIFFPEKRDFFLQDASLFSFGGLTGEDRPYFSRRIGLTTENQPVDILGGIRLTGRVGATSV